MINQHRICSAVRVIPTKGSKEMQEMFKGWGEGTPQSLEHSQDYRDRQEMRNSPAVHEREATAIYGVLTMFQDTPIRDSSQCLF